jgi:hypothetical protein
VKLDQFPRNRREAMVIWAILCGRRTSRSIANQSLVHRRTVQRVLARLARSGAVESNETRTARGLVCTWVPLRALLTDGGLRRRVSALRKHRKARN